MSGALAPHPPTPGSLTRGRQTGIPSLSVAIEWNEAETAPAYFSYYGSIDPRRQLVATMARGQIFNSNEHFAARFIARNEFYQDFLLRQLGMHYLVGASDLLQDSEQMILIGFLRHTDRGTFESPNSRLLEASLPHLRRSLRMAAHIRSNTEAKILSDTALDLSNLAAMALSASGAMRACSS